LGAETENRGTYNAELIQIINCKFFNILNAGINVYRGGGDESTTGPQLHIEGTVFEDVNNMERGSTVMAWGAQVVRIFNNQFIRSGRGGCVIRFDESAWHDIRVGNNNSYNSGRICSFYGNVVKGTITNNPPTKSIQNNL
jgi:poly(beta-D-mannuronate) lyase